MNKKIYMTTGEFARIMRITKEITKEIELC